MHFRFFFFLPCKIHAKTENSLTAKKIIIIQLIKWELCWFWVLIISTGMLSDLRKAPWHGTSHCVIQLSIHHCVHLINGVHGGGKIQQELPNVRQAVFLGHRLTFRQSLQEVRFVRRSQKRSLKHKKKHCGLAVFYFAFSGYSVNRCLL